MAGTLTPLDLSNPHTFIRPSKRIHDEHDVAHFLTSPAYREIVTFLFQLNVAMFPQHAATPDSAAVQQWETGLSTTEEYDEPVRQLARLLDRLHAIVDEAPPDKGPRRFGNVSFRTWYAIVEERIPSLLAEHLPAHVLSAGNSNNSNHSDADAVRAQDELAAYLLGSFGSAQRLDYGTGHELSFLAFLGAIWRLGGFPPPPNKVAIAGVEERQIVLGVFEPYVLSFFPPSPFNPFFLLQHTLDKSVGISTSSDALSKPTTSNRPDPTASGV